MVPAAQGRSAVDQGRHSGSRWPRDMTPSALARKLHVPTSGGVVVIGAPEGYLEALDDPTADVEAHSRPGGAAFVQVFVHDSGELERRLPAALAALAQGGTLWMTYPKQTSGLATDLTRD